MLLTDARRPARTRPDGALIPLTEQDRRLWDTHAITEGVALITGALTSAALGPYQLQAAIAAVHDEAPRAEDTDWPQILGLYELLRTVAPGPMVTLNRIVALAMVHGAQASLREVAYAEALPDFGNKGLLLAVAEDGVALERPRLVVPGDVRGGRYVSDVVELRVVRVS